MLGTQPRGWKLPILFVLFVTCSGGVVKNRDPGTTTEMPTDRENATLLTCPPTEQRMKILKLGEYQILDDGSLLISTSHHVVNASSYVLGAYGAIVCLPRVICETKLGLMKPVYYALMALLLHMQVPMLVCGNRSYNRWSPMVYVVFIYIMVAAYVTAPLCPIPEYPSGVFVTMWYSLPAYLSILGVHLSGGLAVLYSDAVMGYLAASGQVYAKKGTIFVRNKELLCKGTALFGALVFLSTYAFVMSGPYEPPQGFTSLRNHMPYFLPSCMIYLVVNVIVAGLRAGATPEAIRGKSWQAIRDRHLPLFAFFGIAFINWIFGLLVTVTECWSLWDSFVVVSTIYPIVLCMFIFHNGRKVIYADRTCVKILETNGEVLTVWNHPPKRQKKTGSDKEKHPDEKEGKQLMLVVDKNRKEKQPGEKDYKLVLVGNKTGPDKEKLSSEPVFELVEIEETGADEEKQPAREDCGLAIVLENVETDKEKQAIEEECEKMWIILPDNLCFE